MQRHGGELAIDSEVGKGSRFRLVFPAARVREGRRPQPRCRGHGGSAHGRRNTLSACAPERSVGRRTSATSTQPAGMLCPACSKA